MKTSAINILNLPASELSELVKQGDAVSAWQDIERDLDALACKAAMFAAYIGTRAGTDGTGHHDHKDAVKSANRRLVKVRRSIGYTYPERGQINF